MNGKITSWNRASQDLFGWAANEIVGSSIRRIIPAERMDEEDAILERIGRGETIHQFETERLHKDGRSIPIAVTISPIQVAPDKIVGASKIAHDISEDIRLRADLESTHRRFRALADNISQLAWMADGAGWIFWYNQRWFDYTGTTLKDMQGWGWKAVHHPEHVDRVVERITHSWRTGERWEDLFPLRSVSGEYRWFLSRAEPIRDATGQVVMWFGTNTDITNQREKELQIDFLMRELAHRSKNQLAVVQAMARRTLPSARSDEMDKFTGRLRAIASSLDAVMHRNWTGAPLGDLVRLQLGSVQELIGTRIHLHGDETILLNSNAAEVLGLAIHELATNAGKYGSLSGECGTVAIDWDVAGDNLVVRWAERDGPPVAPPARSGFGTIVIKRNPEARLKGQVELDLPPDGLSWTLTAPLAEVLAQAPGQGALPG